MWKETSRARGCIERYSRGFIHNLESPSSVGMACEFLLELRSTLRIHDDVSYRGETLPRHTSWHTGIGVTATCPDFDQPGCFTRLTTGKGSGSSPSFRKHWKQYEMLALCSFVQYPIQSPYGDLPLDTLRFRYLDSDIDGQSAFIIS